MYICYYKLGKAKQSQAQKNTTIVKRPQDFHKHLAIHISIAISTILFAHFVLGISKWVFFLGICRFGRYFFFLLSAHFVVVCSCHSFDCVPVPWDTYRRVVCATIYFNSCKSVLPVFIYIFAQFNWNLITSKINHWRKEKNGNETTRKRKKN